MKWQLALSLILATLFLSISVNATPAIRGFNVNYTGTGDSFSNFQPNYTTTGASTGNFTFFTEPTANTALYAMSWNTNPAYAAYSDLFGAYNSTLIGAATTYSATSGYSGGGINMVSNTGAAGNAISTNYTGIPGSVFWVHAAIYFRKHNPAASAGIFGKWDTGNNNRSILLNFNGTYGLRWQTTATGTADTGNIAGTGALNEGWYVIDGVYTSTNNSLYVNGTLISSIDRATDGVYNTGENYVWGGFYSTGAIGNSLNGTLDEAWFANYVPTDAQIAEISDAYFDKRPPLLVVGSHSNGQNWTGWLEASNSTALVKRNYNFTVNASGSSCAYTTGNWAITDDCTVSTAYNLGGNNISFACANAVTITSNISNFSSIITSGTCKVTLAGGGNFLG
jgi:hypothetical protein